MPWLPEKSNKICYQNMQYMISYTIIYIMHDDVMFSMFNINLQSMHLFSKPIELATVQ